MAATALEAGQLETARRLYRRLLVIDADSVEARMGLGDVALREQEVEAAARWYSSALVRAEEPPQRHAALLAHGRAALAAGQLEAAHKSFKRLTDPNENALRSSVAWGYNGVGLTLLLEGDLRGGVAALEQAVLRAPEEERFRGNLDRALAILRDFPAPAASSDDSTATLDAPGADRQELNPPSVVTVADPPSPTDAALEVVESDGRDPEPSENAVPVEPDPLANRIERPQMAEETAGPGAEDGEAADAEGQEVVEAEAEQGEAAGAGGQVSAGVEAEEGEAAGAEGLEVVEAEAEAPTDADLREAVGEEAEPIVETALPVTPASEPAPQEMELNTDGEGGLVVEEDPDVSQEATPPPPTQPGGQENAASAPLSSRDQILALTEDSSHYLQFGAFSQRANAEIVAAEIRGLTDQSVEITDTESSAGVRLYRVRIGPISSEPVLLETMVAFEANGIQLPVLGKGSHRANLSCGRRTIRWKRCWLVRMAISFSKLARSASARARKRLPRNSAN